jgi:GT2 family glycosyltransferase
MVRAVDSQLRLIVVIPTHNRVELLHRTLNSLSDCQLPSSYDRTIVIENGGQFGAESIVKSLPRRLNAEYVYHEQGNKSAALNSILWGVGSSLLLFFDDDIRMAPEILVAYQQAAQEYSRETFFGGPMGIDYELAPPSWLHPFLTPCARGWDSGPIDAFLDKPLVMGCNWAAFATDLLDAGGFNAARGPGSHLNATGQERDMQRRLMARGLKIRYVANAKVWHYVPVDRCSPDWLIKRKYRNGVETGLSLAGRAGGICGVPRWMMIQAAQCYLQWLASMLRPDCQSRFQARLRWHEMKGRVAGARASRTVFRPTSEHGTH